MPCVYDRVDKRSGNTYRYESTSYRDPTTKKVRTRQTYLGRVDPVTGELIPKAEGGGRRRGAPSDRAIAAVDEAAAKRIETLEAEVKALHAEVARLNAELEARDELVSSILGAADAYRASAGAGLANR